jgi:hypothetical protein
MRKYSIIRMIKSRRMRWAGHVACMLAKRTAYKILAGREDRTGWYGLN